MLMAVSVVMGWPNISRATTMAEPQDVLMDISIKPSLLLAVSLRLASVSKAVLVNPSAITAPTMLVATLMRLTASVA